MPVAPTTCPKCNTPAHEGGHFCIGCGLDLSDPSDRSTVKLLSREDDLEFLVREATRGVYEIEQELGRGGMAAVYLATELELRRKVAIKFLPPEFTFGDGMIERFQREARTAARLDHPNIIPIYRVGTAGRLLYFAMKYVEGRSLADILHDRGALLIPTATAVLEAVGSALAYAHERGVIHRDIKPANILVDQQGVVLVSDFGIAKTAQDDTITKSGAVVGTPQYMSPEQCLGRRLTQATDQYSLGIVGFEMLAGRVPFEAEGALELLQNQISEPPPNLAELRPDAQADLIRIIERSMSKKPEDRYPTMTEFTDDVELTRVSEQHAREGRAQLKALAVGDTISGLKVVTPISNPSRVRKRRRKRLIVGSLVAAGAAGAVGVWPLAISPRDEPLPGVELALGERGGPADDMTTTPLVPSARDSAIEEAERQAGRQQDTLTALPQAVPEDEQPEAQPVTQGRAAPPVPAPAPATLLLDSVPRGATVRIDGTEMQGDRSVLQPGNHTVEIVADGYQPFSQTVTLNAGRMRTLRPILTPVPGEPGQLSVGSLPPGILLIDGQRIGTLPIRGRQITAARHRIQIVAPNRVPYDTVITVEPGQTVNLRLIRLKPEGN